jgi:hypothetical protein
MENMKKDPNKHKEEWGIWDGVVNDVIEKGERSQGFL